MNQRHLHDLIGKAIYECKKRLFQRLKEGVSLETAIALFVAEIGMALDVIAREVENLSSSSVSN